MALMRKSENNFNSNESEKESHTVLGQKAVFEGKLVYQGHLKIDGEFKGDIETEDTLILGESAVVSATIKVGSLIVRGVFTGTAQVKEKAELLGQAKFFGNISTKSLIIEDGVIFEGECHMHKGNASPKERGAVEVESLSILH